MCNDRVSTEEKIERFFQRTEAAYSQAQVPYQNIINTINCALCDHNLDLILSLIPYIESGDGILAYQHIGEIHRILRILHIIELEKKHQKILFLEGCMDTAALLEKYMLSLYAFRRLLFQLSDTSVEEASLYLKRSELSIYAVYIITQGDLMLPDSSFYEKVVEVYSDFWSEEDIELLHALVREN